jgi:hypothetical protein
VLSTSRPAPPGRRNRSRGANRHLLLEDGESVVAALAFADEKTGWLAGAKYVGVSPFRYTCMLLRTDDQGAHWKDASATQRWSCFSTVSRMSPGLTSLCSLRETTRRDPDTRGAEPSAAAVVVLSPAEDAAFRPPWDTFAFTAVATGERAAAPRALMGGTRCFMGRTCAPPFAEPSTHCRRLRRRPGFRESPLSVSAPARFL